jgi:uncharacterized YkwD family protein
MQRISRWLAVLLCVLALAGCAGRTPNRAPLREPGPTPATPGLAPGAGAPAGGVTSSILIHPSGLPQGATGQPGPGPGQARTGGKGGPVRPVGDLSDDERRMIDLVNQERQQRGLGALQVDMDLVAAARTKAQDMVALNYFDHQSPTYGSPFDMMRRFGITYRAAGENLAGNQDVAAAHATLMESPGHRENILKGEYSRLGIGVVPGSQYGKIFVQLFAS